MRNDTYADLTANPELARSVLTQGEVDATTEQPWLTRTTFGRAIERPVVENPDVAELFEHLGGAGQPGPFNPIRDKPNLGATRPAVRHGLAGGLAACYGSGLTFPSRRSGAGRRSSGMSVRD